MKRCYSVIINCNRVCSGGGAAVYPCEACRGLFDKCSILKISPTELALQFKGDTSKGKPFEILT